MSISARCPHCGKQYKLADRLEGKKVACKSCGEAFIAEPADAAPAKSVSPRLMSGRKSRAEDNRSDDSDDGDEEDDERPSRRRGKAKRRKDDEDDDESGNGIPALVWILGGGGVALLLVGVLLFVLLRKGSDTTVAQNPIKNPPADVAAPPVAPPNNAPPGNVNPPLGNVNPAVPVPNPAPNGGGWRVKPDPAPAKVELSDIARAPIPFKGVIKGAIPSRPSKYLFVRQSGSVETATVIDLDAWRVVASVQVPPRYSADFDAISADGTLWLRNEQKIAQRRAVEVFDFRTNQVYPGVMPNQEPAYFGFISDSKAIMVGRDFTSATVSVWDVRTGKPENSYIVTSEGGMPITVSPGGRYLAYYHSSQKWVRIHDAATGELLGELPGTSTDNPAGTAGGAIGLAFSDDGEELALATYSTLEKIRCISWNMGTGKTAALQTHPVDRRRPQYGSGASYSGKSLEWLPNRAGWLLNSAMIIERDTGNLLHVYAEPASDWIRRHVVGRKQIVSVYEVHQQRVELSPLPPSVLASIEKASKRTSP